MKSIKFSHRYTKMPIDCDPSMLLEVFVVDGDLHPKFVNYDTQICGGGKYKLVQGKKLVLLLQTIDGNLWTTIRRHTDANHEYYRAMWGTMFGIDVVEKNMVLADC